MLVGTINYVWHTYHTILEPKWHKKRTAIWGGGSNKGKTLSKSVKIHMIDNLLSYQPKLLFHCSGTDEDTVRYVVDVFVFYVKQRVDFKLSVC